MDLQKVVVVGDHFRTRYLEASINTKDVIRNGHSMDPCSRVRIYSLQCLDNQPHPNSLLALHHRYHHPSGLAVDSCLLALRRERERKVLQQSRRENLDFHYTSVRLVSFNAWAGTAGTK
jgi:hypothetical protein